MNSIKFSFRSVARAAAIAIVGFIALSSWAISSPVGSSPDDNYHLVSIWCAQGDRRELCDLSDESRIVHAPTELAKSQDCFAFNPQQSASCPPFSRSEWAEVSHSNAKGGYPPVFYLTMSFFASENIQYSVVAMRLFNAFLFCAFLMTTLLLAPKRIQIPTIIGVLATIVPLGAFIVPSTNPSSWAFLSAAILWPALAGYFSADDGARRWSLLAIAYLAVFIGAGSRSDSAIYSLIALVVAALLCFKRIQEKPISIIPAIPIAAISVAFYLTSGQSSVVKPELLAEGLDFQGVISNLIALPGLWTGALGGWGLGWLDTAMPALVTATTTFIFSGVLLAGMSVVSRLKNVALVLIGVALVFVPMYVLTNGGYVVGEWVQPRYLLPLLVMFAGVSWWTMNNSNQYLNRTQRLILISGLSVANSVALHTNLRRYITGVDVGGVNLNENVEWWWTSSGSPMFVWILGSAAFLVALVLIEKTIEKEAAPTDHGVRSLPLLALLLIPSLVALTFQVNFARNPSDVAELSRYSKFDYGIPADKPIGELLSGVLVRQHFKAEAANLRAVSVLFATYNRENEGRFELSIVREGGERICSETHENSALVDNNFVTLFCRTRVDLTVSEKLQIEVRAIEGSTGSAPTIWVSEADSYHEGVMELDGVPQSGDMVFRAYY